MRKTGGTVSPYLRRPLRTYAEFIGEQTRHALVATPGYTLTGTADRGPARSGHVDAELRG